MAIALRDRGPGKRAVSILAAAALAAGSLLRAASGPPAEPQPNVHSLSGRFPEKPSIAPSIGIPVEPLGFAAPGQNFLGMRNTMVSLDFLGEDRLLFTFRVPGLMRREPGNTAEDQRQIRAVVLSLPAGTVQAETDWTLHDRWRYLWTLDDDHFLLRDGNSISQFDAALKPKPLFQFPGPLLSISMSPGRQYLVVNSREPVKPAGKAAEATSDANAGDRPQDDNATPDLVLRILRRESSQVMLVTRIRNPVELPINDEGYLSPLRSSGMDWMIALNFFTGETRDLGKVKSACAPELVFLSENEALANTCSDSGNDAIVAMSTSGSTLWTDTSSDRLVGPLFALSRNGLRFARESLYVTHAINAFAPLGAEDIKGQWVCVFDSATGNVAFESPATPILDGGGNMAISPSGRRIALLNAGSIQVFDLPAPPALPDSALPHSKP